MVMRPDVLKALCALPMRPMSRTVLALRQLGMSELADELTVIRDSWARAVANAEQQALARQESA